MLFEPHQLRQRPGGRRHLHAYAEYIVAVILIQAAALVSAPLVVPHDAGTDHARVFVKQHRVVRRGRHRESEHASKAVLHLLPAGTHRFHEGVEPHRGVLLRPSRFQMLRRVFFEGRGTDIAVKIDDHRLTAAGAKVHAKKLFHYKAPSILGALPCYARRRAAEPYANTFLLQAPFPAPQNSGSRSPPASAKRRYRECR